MRERPLWQWVLLALSPSLAYDVVAASSMVFEPLKELSVLVGLALPLVVLVVLIILANAFFKARNNPSFAARGGFVLGFGALNALLWLGGCAMTINDMSFH
jgi:Na+-translocating ferredoxin:NAD+ oxidoreductase RnfE subunit